MLAQLSVQDHMINDFGKFVMLPFLEKPTLARPTPIISVPERKKEFVLLRGSRASLVEEKLPRQLINPPPTEAVTVTASCQKVVSFLDVQKKQAEEEASTTLQKKKEDEEEASTTLQSKKDAEEEFVPVRIPKEKIKPTTSFPVEKKMYLACQKADCKFGAKCMFAHTFDVFEPSLCKFDKKCKNGMNCTFKHSSETKRDFVVRRNIKFIS